MKKLLAILVLGLLLVNPSFSKNKPTEEIRLICVNNDVKFLTDTVSFSKIKGKWHAREGNVIFDPTLKKDKHGGTSTVKVTADTLEIHYKNPSANFETWHTYSRISGEKIEKTIKDGKTEYYKWTCKKASRKF